MHKIVRIILILLFSGCVGKPIPSTVTAFTVSASDSLAVENLVVLAKVWGFAKYHHPVFSTDSIDVDRELFELLPKVSDATKEERNAVLVEWVEGLGEFTVDSVFYTAQVSRPEVHCEADLAWLRDTDLLGESLSSLLGELQWAKRGKNLYVVVGGGDGQASFIGEKRYTELKEFTTEYQLLALFRMWNMVEYYFPSVRLTDKKWSDVLRDQIPEFTGTKSKREYQIAISRLMVDICDSHSENIIPEPFLANWTQLPLSLRYVDNELVAEKVYETPSSPLSDPIKPGDEIVEIDGHDSDYFLDISRNNISHSNIGGVYKNAAGIAEGNNKQQVSVSVRSDGEVHNYTFRTVPQRTKWEYDNESIMKQSYYRLLNDSVGYLHPGRFRATDGDKIMETFRNTKAIIVDLRHYPLEYMPDRFVGKYFTDKKVHFATLTKPMHWMPGYYYESPRFLGERRYDYYRGRVIVLANEQTLSQPEYTVMAFQACPNTIVVGSQTAGADGGVAFCLFPGGVETVFSGLGVFYPDGTNTQRVGVRIDHHVTPTIEGIREGRDELLEKALEIIGVE